MGSNDDMHLDPSSILKTIVLKRNSYPNELETKETTNLSEHTQMWHRKGEYCPEGTVAILRSSMTDLPPKRPSNRGTSKYTNSDAPKVAGGEYAAAFLPGEDYHGANAVINVWNPKVESEEFSAAQMWVTDGGGTKIESIEAGWIVTSFNPHPSFFTYWTNDGYETSGCYNMQCSGFILASTKIALGARIDPVSTYGGDQRSVRVKINQAAYFRSLEFVDGGGFPNSAFGIMGHATRPECYDIDVKDPTVRRGVHFYFGGPGFSLECN
ncbi:hypothetical protein LINPERPRIM_LOCUS19269 [Linum perenne]